jgi:hypothetical protein
MTRLAASLAALALVTLAAPASAVSFDCAKARTKVETLICKDPQLSRQDEDLAKAYGEALKVWDGRIAAYVKLTQRGWAASRALRPPDSDMGGILCDEGPSALPCLRAIHADRIAVLRSPGFRLSGVYLRGQDRLSLKVVPTGLNLGYMLADAKASPGFTEDTAPARVANGQDVLSFPLVGTGPDACRLDAAFTADQVVLTQRGPCGGAKLGGWWKRDQTRDPDAEQF